MALLREQVQEELSEAMARSPRWCVAEIKDGMRIPISPAFEYMVDAEKRREDLLAKEEQRGKNLEVIEASYPVDPLKQPRRMKTI